MRKGSSMDSDNIISLLGGVAMFLFGMSVMGDSLKKVAGSKMEGILNRLAKNPIQGILLGTGVTAAIQSSSATSVMVVGFEGQAGDRHRSWRDPGYEYYRMDLVLEQHRRIRCQHRIFFQYRKAHGRCGPDRYYPVDVQ